MTKCTVFNPEQQEENGDKKPVEFAYWLDGIDWVTQEENNIPPRGWDNVALLATNRHMGMDLMHGWDDDRALGIIYLGHWNDGVVE